MEKQFNNSRVQVGLVNGKHLVTIDRFENNKWHETSFYVDEETANNIKTLLEEEFK